jgi:hypothetical protein
MAYINATLVTAGILSLTIIGALVYNKEPKAEQHEKPADEQTGDSFDLREAFKRHVCRPEVMIYFIHRCFWNGGYVLLRVFLYDYVVRQYGSHSTAGLALTLLGAGQLFMSLMMAGINCMFATNKYLIQLVSLALMTAAACAMGLVAN